MWKIKRLGMLNAPLPLLQEEVTDPAIAGESKERSSGG